MNRSFKWSTKAPKTRIKFLARSGQTASRDFRTPDSIFGLQNRSQRVERPRNRGVIVFLAVSVRISHVRAEFRFDLPSFQAPGRVLGPPAVLGDRMGTAATKAEIKNSTAARGSAYSTKNRAFQKSLMQDGERH